MEYIDILDEQGNLTGKTGTREEVHKKGYWHRAINVFMINKDNQLLIQKRAASKKKHPNLWDYSCAGHLSAGDSSISGAMREIEEELGIKVEEKNMKLIDTLLKSYSPKPDFFENEFQDIYLCLQDIAAEEITLQLEEVAEAKYIPFKEYKQRILEEDKEFVNRKKTHVQVLEKIEEIIKERNNYSPIRK